MKKILLILLTAASIISCTTYNEPEQYNNYKRCHICSEYFTLDNIIGCGGDKGYIIHFEEFPDEDNYEYYEYELEGDSTFYFYNDTILLTYTKHQKLCGVYFTFDVFYNGNLLSEDERVDMRPYMPNIKFKMKQYGYCLQ